ncbi:MAG: MBL fold metallo-hydrolase [Dehalococcoidia bacterium]|nr:MBL fold metallo-hydrolase [Dehalococcoidia bacterium]
MIIETLTTGGYLSNCYLCASETTREGVVIDPGEGAEIVLDRIAELRLKIAYILLTHGHPDHTGAVRRIKEAVAAPLAMHAADAALLRDKALHAMLGFDTVAMTPDITLEDGETIKAGELSLTVLHTPGHTPGGICLLGEGMVFTGDTLFQMGIGRTDLTGGNTEQLFRSIHDKLLTLPDSTAVYPGHGPATTIGAERLMNPFFAGRD